MNESASSLGPNIGVGRVSISRESPAGACCVITLVWAFSALALNAAAVAQPPEAAADSGGQPATGTAAVNAGELEPSRARIVVLLRPPADDAALTDAFNRLWAELHIHGFFGEAFDREPGEDPPATLTELATERAAVAAFAFVRRDAALSLEVVLVDVHSGQTTPRRLGFAAGTDAAGLIAVRAVDLLRASLQEFPESAEPAPEPEVVPEPEGAPPRRSEAPSDSPRAWSLAAEGTLVWPGSRFSVGFGPAIGVFHRPLLWFQWGVWLAGPVFGTRFDAERGSATVMQELGLAEARFTFLRVQAFQLALLAGAGAFLLQAEGDPRAPLRSERDSVWSSLFVAGIRAEQGLGEHFALGLSARALAFAPALGVAILGERAPLQQPALQISLGFSVEL
jgi:hypothetical protein